MPASLHPWVNRVEYPFATREFDTGEGWMNYVDCGRGRPIVFVHGSMTWSFLWRRLIEDLSDQHRCIAPDHIGFGLSDKPLDTNYWPEGHARRFGLLMEYLNLRDITLVVHDMGCPIAFDWAYENSDRIREIVVMNSYMWDLRENPAAMRLASIIGNPLNQFYYRMLHATPSFILPPLFADRHRLPKPIQQQYLKPYMTHAQRRGVYTMVASWQRSAPYFEHLWAKRAKLAHKRMLLLWGTKDPLFGGEALARFTEAFPQASVLEYSNSGRFIPEEQAATVGGELRYFLMDSGVSMAILKDLGG